jgi:hypothetical protein
MNEDTLNYVTLKDIYYKIGQLVDISKGDGKS